MFVLSIATFTFTLLGVYGDVLKASFNFLNV